MLYSIICAGLSDKDVQTLADRNYPPAMTNTVVMDASETRNVLVSLIKVNNDAIFIDLNSIDETALLEALNTYRVQRPGTRIIVYAQGRQSGDLTLSTLRGMGVYDILAQDEAPGDLAEYIIQALESDRADYASSARWGISQQAPAQQKPKINLPGINIKLGWGRKTAGKGVQYMPHMLVAVWSPTGFAKSFTAYNLAALAAAKGFDAALVNYDLQCPELDAYFGIQQTGLTADPAGKGVMTFGEDMRPELVDRFMVERFGVKYLPAGNKLGQIGTPDIDKEKLDQVLRNVYNRAATGQPAITIVDAGRCFEYAPTLAALRQAGVVLVPTDGSLATMTVTKDQIAELERLGGCCSRFIELFLDAEKRGHRICRERIAVKFDWQEYATATKPVALRRKDWEAALNKLAPGTGNTDYIDYQEEEKTKSDSIKAGR